MFYPFNKSRYKIGRFLLGFILVGLALAFITNAPAAPAVGLKEPLLPIGIAHAATPQEIAINNFPISDAAIPKKIATIVLVTPKTVSKTAEARLLIPKIGLNAAIKDMGMTEQGAMAVPGNNTDVGWFSIGTRPGEVGSAVIGGHNEWADAAGVFERLDLLRAGDRLSVVDAAGTTTTFIVRETRTYNPTDDGTDIFQSAVGAHLNLITCSGVWDQTTKSYTKRLVIFTDQTLP